LRTRDWLPGARESCIGREREKIDQFRSQNKKKNPLIAQKKGAGSKKKGLTGGKRSGITESKKRFIVIQGGEGGAGVKYVGRKECSARGK